MVGYPDLVSYLVHVYSGKLGLDALDILLDIFIYSRDIFILDTGKIQGLSGSDMEVAVSPGLCYVSSHLKILCGDDSSGNTHLKHELSGNL